MKNTLKFLLKNVGTSALLYLAIVGTTKESLAQNLYQNTQNSVKTEIDISKNESPLLRLDNNISKYDPSLKDYVLLLKRVIWTKSQEDVINELLEKNIMANISDTNQRILSIIYCLESSVNFGNESVEKKIASIARKVILKENVKFLLDFGKEYDNWYKLNKEEIENELNKALSSKKEELSSKKEELSSKKEELSSKKEELSSKKEELSSKKEELSSKKEELSKMKESTKKEMYVLLNRMTLQDLKYKPEIYERVKEAKLIFNKYEIDYSDNLHVVSLFNAVE